MVEGKNQKEKIIRIIEKFDLSHTASRIYFELVQIGKSSADRIAKKAGTYKPNTYDALERLIEGGLVSYVIENNKRYYIPTNPEKLTDILQENKKEALEGYDRDKLELDNILPALTASYLSVSNTEIFEIYKGREGYKALVNDIIREKPTYWKGFGNLQFVDYFPQYFKRWFSNVRVRLFSLKTTEVEERLKLAKGLDVQLKYLPKFQMPIVWTIFGENLLIIIYEPEIICFRIKAEQVVKTFANQFDYLWEHGSG